MIFAFLKLPSESLALFQSDNAIEYWQTGFNRVGDCLLFVRSLRKMNRVKEGTVVLWNGDYFKSKAYFKGGAALLLGFPYFFPQAFSYFPPTNRNMFLLPSTICIAKMAVLKLCAFLLEKLTVLENSQGLLVI